MDWRRVLSRIADEIEDTGVRVGTVIGGRTADPPPVHVAAYRSYGTPEVALIRGRVLLGEPLPPASVQDRWWLNLGRAYKRLRSREVPGARVRVRFNGTSVLAVADTEGFITAELRPRGPVPDDSFWHEARIEPIEPQAPPSIVPVAVPASPRFGVISDLDDTVLKTDVRQVVRMAREVLFGNAHTRIPFAGVGAFYRALHAGTNPLFYVSSSPWNLYDVLSQFLHLHRIPAGPMDLRDWGASGRGLPIGHHSHKRAAIDRILSTYPSLPFILVGDSGQQDPEIYRGVVHDHPERVLGIYIRSVVSHPMRIEAVQTLAAELADHDIDLVLANDTLDAARHAATNGWIPADAVADVARDREMEESQ